MNDNIIKQSCADVKYVLIAETAAVDKCGTLIILTNVLTSAQNDIIAG